MKEEGKVEGKEAAEEEGAEEERAEEEGAEEEAKEEVVVRGSDGRGGRVGRSGKGSWKVERKEIDGQGVW